MRRRPSTRSQPSEPATAKRARDRARAGGTPAAPHDGGVAWQLTAFLVGVTGFWAVFYTSQPPRFQAITWLLIPDQLVRLWMGGSLSRVGLLDRVPVLSAAALIVGVDFLAGLLIMRWARADRGLTRLERFLFAVGVGLNTVSLFTLAVGLLHQLHQPLFFLIPALLVVVAAAWYWKRGAWRDATPRSVESTTGPVGSETPSWVGRHGLWLVVPFAAVIVLGGMLPPWHFDVREYHLQVPKEWYQQGGVVFLPHNVYGNMPLGAEMHAVLGMVVMPGPLAWWWGSLVGKAVIAALAPLTALALYAAGRRWFSSTTGVVAALVYLSTPWIAYVSMAGLIEGAVAFYLLLAVYALFLWSRDDEDWGKLLLAGYLAGSAVACKYPSLLFVVAPLTVWVCLGRRRLAWRPTAVFLLAVTCGCGLWFAKNWALTGNPVYPLMGHVLDGRTRTAELTTRWEEAHQVPRDAQQRRYSLAQLAHSAAQVGWRSEWLSPLLYPLAAMAVFCRGRRRRFAAVLALLLAFVLATWWLMTHRIDRFWVPGLPLLALLAGIGATWSAAAAWRRAATALILVGLVWCFLVIATRYGGHDNRFLVALETLRLDIPDPRDFHVSRVHPAHRYLNQHVRPGHRVLLVGDAQAFDLEVDALYNTCFDPCILQSLLRGRETPNDVLSALRDKRISHVLVSWSEIDRYRSPGNYGFSDFVTRQLIREELAGPEGPLSKVDIDVPAELVELFEVRGVPANAAAAR